ncbi:16S rRNA (uracil(1498)-N(3))-methyltransferase [Arthrobacter sp. JZ12]|uniref:16S rRNA (uracil(1498)-N(3))-methyltransferase n=1 Tax=Arthrobacter sp. JZ12 TaxID=2654190 RepID=UPI002B4755D3|nr:16S rRNA (uracil(1498)-N(3))-methyltransferase [Arthrobacter sp. JZ12]WRH25001.1 16S rRNA (uracil(1498)-N(3))-methyltransferase [Arthrobacter sp. JZ12]
MTNQAFFGDPADVIAAGVGGTFVLRGPEAHHAATVKRVVAGETIDILDGRGRRLTCTVMESTATAVSATVDAVSVDALPEPRIVLVQALAKADRSELAVEAATELGVDMVLPWQADRSIVRWRADKAVKGRSKWESLVRAAAKQSRRTHVPEVLEVEDTRGLARWLESIGGGILLHEDAEESLAGYWSRSAGRSPGTVGTIALIVGPEGGISPQEVDLLVKCGAVPVQLGRNVLRASTAGPAAIAVLNQLAGRW